MLIGGATTSPAHTALRIDPAYPGPVCWVKDASRAVDVVRKLASATHRPDYASAIAADYEAVRQRHATRSNRKPLIPIEQARANRHGSDWAGTPPEPPKHAGLHLFEHWPLTELIEHIDWTPFFQTWELAGRFPAILDDDVVGEAARALYADAREMLDRIVAEDWLQARAVCAILPAASDDDDVLVYNDERRGHVMERLVFLRQQADKPGANLCLADFIAPKDGAKPDWIGLFAVTTGIGIEAAKKRLPPNDDYSGILLQALADRLAEALAEALHERVRKELWGYAADEQLSNADLVRERYRGIRPAPGYPACPDHSEKEKIFRLLDAPRNIGVELTESWAMHPAASVSGYYFSHPGSKYFVVGKLAEDQLEDYANRQGIALETARSRLRPNLD